MLVDRYAPVDLFTQLPGRCLRPDPVLRALDRLLEDEDLFVTLKQDLAQRHPHTLTRGRHSTPVEVILRMLVVMRLYGIGPRLREMRACQEALSAIFGPGCGW